jgi:hypothetical protein
MVMVVRAVISAMPIPVVPRIVSGTEINGRSVIAAVIIRRRIVIAGIIPWAIVAAANSYTHANVHSRAGLAGKADYS